MIVHLRHAVVEVTSQGAKVIEIYRHGINREWPLLLQPFKLMARPGDRGLGDIIERVIGPVGGDAYKAWYLKVFGVPCGCTRRSDNLNQRFPLPQ
jgi:hypothetical protein